MCVLCNVINEFVKSFNFVAKVIRKYKKIDINVMKKSKMVSF